MTTTRKRVLSGMQASGLLHLGNWLGALENWNALQEQYDCFFFVADWHALSSNYADTSRIREYVRDMLIDWLAAGIDPERATVFIQSQVSDHAVLHLLFSMMIPVSWLERTRQVALRIGLHGFTDMDRPLVRDARGERSQRVRVVRTRRIQFETTWYRQRRRCYRRNGIEDDVVTSRERERTEKQ